MANETFVKLESLKLFKSFQFFSEIKNIFTVEASLKISFLIIFSSCESPMNCLNQSIKTKTIKNDTKKISDHEQQKHFGFNFKFCIFHLFATCMISINHDIPILKKIKLDVSAGS